MADSELIVRLRWENSDLKQKLKEVTDASGKSAGSMASNFKSSLGSIGAAIGVAFSVKAVIDFGKQSVMAFADAEAAAASLKNTVSNMGGTDIQSSGLQAWIDAMEKMSGFKGDELSKALETLITQTGSGAKAQQALSIAMDIAATKGISLAEAGNKVYLVMTGMTSTMKEFGMTTRDGATDMDYLRELGDKMAGGLSTSLDTLSGKLRITETAMHNMKEAIGETLAASVSAGGGWISNLLGGMASQINIDAEMGKLFGTALFDKERLLMSQLGATMGKGWMEGYVAVLQGKTQEHDVGWAASMPAPSGFTSITPTVVGATVDPSIAIAAAKTAADAIFAGNADLQHKIYDLTHTALQQKLYDIDLEAAADKKAGYSAVAIATWVKDAKAAAYTASAADAAKAAGAFQAAWSPISLMGGSLPELTKYIGNLSQASTTRQKVTLTVEVDVKGTGTKVSATDAKKIAAVVAPVVAAVTHGQGWRPRTSGGMGGGNAQ